LPTDISTCAPSAKFQYASDWRSVAGRPCTHILSFDAPTYAESEWLAMYPHPITLHVHVPKAPQIAPVCDGHTEVLSGLPLSTTIGHVRDRILHDTLHQAVGASKLKMWVHGRPATLRQSLAYWHLADGAQVELSGGK